MKYLQLYVWDPSDPDLLIRRLQEVSPDIIEWIGPEESTFHHRPEFEVLKEYKRTNPHVEVKFITAAIGVDPVDENGFVFETFPLYFFLDVLDAFTADEINNFVPTESFKYKFFCLNHNGHYFRCRLVDLLTRENLFKPENIITWHNRNVDEYNFKWFQQRVITLPEDKFYDQGLFNSTKLIPQYHDTFMAVVPETSVNDLFITEKTIMPMLWLKPFIILGGRGHNAYLKSMGFELFEELVDYSFDSMHDVAERTEAFIEQVKRIDAMTFEDINSMYKELMPKLLHNKQRLMEVGKDTSLQLKQVVHWKTVDPDNTEHLVHKNSTRVYRWYQIARRAGMI